MEGVGNGSHSSAAGGLGAGGVRGRPAVYKGNGLGL